MRDLEIMEKRMEDTMSGLNSGFKSTTLACMQF